MVHIIRWWYQCNRKVKNEREKHLNQKKVQLNTKIGETLGRLTKKRRNIKNKKYQQCKGSITSDPTNIKRTIKK